MTDIEMEPTCECGHGKSAHSFEADDSRCYMYIKTEDGEGTAILQCSCSSFAEEGPSEPDWDAINEDIKLQKAGLV